MGIQLGRLGCRGWKALPLSVWLLIAAVPGAATDQTLVLQQGLEGYAGAEDTFVSSLDWDTPPQHTLNAGVSAELTVSRDAGDSSLLRFDLGAIPANSQVLSATLDLYSTTWSSWSGAQQLVRRIELFPLAVDWHEGNQNVSPIDNPGEHGATGDFAFHYYPGEGLDQPWSQRGLAAGIDFDASPEAFADVVDPGWYRWTVTELVRDWVRGDRANLGMVLRDATGYQDDNVDSRTFVSGQEAVSVQLRPILSVTFNPDTPMAVAGSDQEILSWDGSPITLDGSASRDRPGGNDATLQFSWSILQAAYGSSMQGVVGTSDAVTSFTPDAAGEWVIELEVTNEIGESATDTTRVRVLSISQQHPRIFLTPTRLADLRSRALASDPRWLLLAAEAAQPDSSMVAKALVSQVSEQATPCIDAIAQALGQVADPADWPSKAGDIAIVYDWCHPQLGTTDEAAILAYLASWAGDVPKPEDVSGWGNYWPRYSYSWALAGLAAYGHHPDAQLWFDHFRHQRFAALDVALLDRIAAGGGWPEGMIYDWIANNPRVKSVEAWVTATGEDLFRSTPWFEERLGYLLLHRWPGTNDQWGDLYHPYASVGDTERQRGSVANYERIMALILASRFAANPLAAQLQAYLTTGPTAGSMSFLAHDEFLFFDPGVATSEPVLTTHLAAGTGTLLTRSGWPAGAADTDPGATHLSFQCGDHFSYHQHYDQNHFALFSGDDLLVDSGVYSGEGLSDHDINYYVRTVAHNTLVVYNPDEDFSSARPDSSSNDGGQRSMDPASRSPWDMEYFDQHALHYETGDIDRFADAPGFTWVRGDATAAYNNPSYNQAMDTAASSNVAKVDRFMRELVYLRAGPASSTEMVVLYDRVGVSDPAFSGAATKLLFHTLGEPSVGGGATVVSPGETLHGNATTASASSGGSAVHFSFLLPAAHNVRKVGERGVKAFWVFGANHDWHWDPNEPQPRPVNDFEDMPYGEWRLELEPADFDLEHRFLTTLQPTASGLAPVAVTAVTAAGVEGVYVADSRQPSVVLFSSAADGSPPIGTISYGIPLSDASFNLIFDLVPGATYDLDLSSGQGQHTVSLTPGGSGALQASAEGVLAFIVESGLIFADGFEQGHTGAWSGGLR